MPRGVEQGADSGGAGRGVQAFAAVALAPWLCRFLTLFDESQAPVLADLRGFVSDAGVALLLLGLLWPVARLARWLAVAAVGVLALAYYGNHEAVLALGAIVSPLDAGFLIDPTFVTGSVLAVGHPLLLALTLLGSLALAWRGLRPVPARRAAVAALAGGCLLAATAAWPPDPRFTNWRQVNALAHNLQWLTRGGLGPAGGDASGFPDPPSAMLDLLPGLAADLDAKPRFPFEGRRRNVLLVVLEGVSGYYLPAAAEVHGRSSLVRMNHLDRAFRENLGFATFIAQQRRTNRGLYAILCGEPPRLVSGMPKMTVAARRGWRRCLPEVLRDAGYETVYLQAAPLAFMLKDRFLPTIGFDAVLGRPFFRHHYSQTKWGVDDKAFFEQAFDEVERLETTGEPWFLTLLTVGTHHPYVVPDDFLPGRGTPMIRAFAYLDAALGEFLARLERAGVRDQTLVLLTSDESAGAQGLTADALASELTQNWGFTAALLPERTRARVREPFAQQDLALSIVDYLGLAEQGKHFFGRSLFRDYDRGRPLFFSNLNFHTISGVNADGLLVHCAFEGHDCNAHDAFDGLLFAPKLEPAEPKADFVETVKEMALRSRPPSDEAPFVIPLLADPVVEVRERDWQMVQGVVEISLQPHEWLEIEYEAELRGAGSVDLRHDARFGPTRYLMNTEARVASGQSVRLRYTFASDQPIPYVSIRTHTRLVDGLEADLVFKRRRFLLRRAGERPPAGIRIESFSLDPPDPAALTLEVTPLESYRGYLEDLEKKGIGAVGDARRRRER